MAAGKSLTSPRPRRCTAAEIAARGLTTSVDVAGMLLAIVADVIEGELDNRKAKTAVGAICALNDTMRLQLQVNAACGQAPNTSITIAPAQITHDTLSS